MPNAPLPAKEIKTLIDDSVDKVDAGSKQLDQAGATMDEIVQAVKLRTNIMSEISAASQEQGAGIEQVNNAITQMDEVTRLEGVLIRQGAGHPAHLCNIKKANRKVSLFWHPP